jgi:hypothetical protein
MRFYSGYSALFEGRAEALSPLAGEPDSRGSPAIHPLLSSPGLRPKALCPLESLLVFRRVCSPAGLDHAGNFPPQRQLTEAQTAHSELSQVGPRPPAQLAPVVLTALELRLASVLDSLCCRRHRYLSLRLFKGSALKRFALLLYSRLPSASSAIHPLPLLFEGPG